MSEAMMQLVPDTTYHVIAYSGNGDDFGALALEYTTDLPRAREIADQHYASGAYRWVDVEFDNERDFELEVAYHVGEGEG